MPAQTMDHQTLKSGKSRPIYELSERDLTAHPVWVWAAEDEDEQQDETWVHPINAELVPISGGTCLVSATLTFASGLSLAALVSTSGTSTTSMFFQPVAVFINGEYFPYGGKEDASFLCAELQRSMSDLFPDTWRLNVKIAGESTPRMAVSFA